MKDVILGIMSDAASAAHLPKNRKQNIDVNVLHRRLMRNGAPID